MYNLKILKITPKEHNIATKNYLQQNRVCSELNIYSSPEIFYMTTGRDGCAIFHVCRQIKAYGPGSWEDQAENQCGYRQGQPWGAAGQVGPVRTGEFHGGKDKELSGGGGGKNNDAEGG